jgi:hypothetical protein
MFSKISLASKYPGSVSALSNNSRPTDRLKENQNFQGLEKPCDDAARPAIAPYPIFQGLEKFVPMPGKTGRQAR